MWYILYIYYICYIYIIFIIYRMYYHVLCMNHLIFEGRDPILTTQVSLTCNGYVSADPSRQQGERAKKSKKERWTEGKQRWRDPWVCHRGIPQMVMLIGKRIFKSWEFCGYRVFGPRSICRTRSQRGSICKNFKSGDLIGKSCAQTRANRYKHVKSVCKPKLFDHVTCEASRIKITRQT